MDQFLQFCKSNLSNLDKFKSIHLVVGNESCDLDSAVSAIVLAYIKFHELPVADNPQLDNKEKIVLPILNVYREDLHLRTEIVFWFEQILQFNLEWLICRDEIQFDRLESSTAEIFISLVDHNENKELQRLLPKAKWDEIIDHHKALPDSQSFHGQFDQSKIQIDTQAGSCCSLIALRYFKANISDSRFNVSATASPTNNNNNNNNDDDSPTCSIFDSQIALVLYGPILLDTICFSHQAKRFSSKDYEAINKLEDLMKHPTDLEPSLYDRNEIYQKLVTAKNSFDKLSLNDLLRKDMKIVESVTDNNLIICISSTTGILLTELSLRDKLKELKHFCDNPPKSAVFNVGSQSQPKIFSAIVLMSLDNRIENNLRRQLALYSTNKHLMRSIATCIERSELELELIVALESLRIYNQNNLTASRKVVLPIISTILNGPGRSTDENSKRNDLLGSINGNGDNQSSAPSSFIQQPDSYYGSFIDDSFVGEFVGDYSDPNPMVIDPQGNNLVMMSPGENSCMTHPHEIEFDFDSFGPESIIFSGNGAIEQKLINGGHATDLKPESASVPVEPTEPKTDEKTSEMNDPKKEDRQLEEKKPDEKKPQESKSEDKMSEGIKPEEKTAEEKKPEKQEVKSNVSVAIESNETKNNETKADSIVEQSPPEIKLDSSPDVLSTNEMLEATPVSGFDRNTTLTKSQRRKIKPQVNITELVLEPNEPLVSMAPMVNDEPVEQEPSLVSSENSADDSSRSIDIANSSALVDDPLGVNKQTLNASPDSNRSLGLNRQPSMKKKLEVNYTVFFENADGQDQSNDVDDSNPKNAPETVTNGHSDHVNDNDANEDNNEDSWRSSPLSIDEIHSIDLKIIEPHKKVISHGGHLSPISVATTGNGSNGHTGNSLEFSRPAVVLFVARYLPDRSRPDYAYVMDNLFLYVVNTLHNMVADDYILIYLHNNSGNNMPTFKWLKRCYQMIDRKLKKNLKGLYLVHPTFWLKTLIIMSQPFISWKFSRKLKFVRSLDELKKLLPIDEDVLDSIKSANGAINETLSAAE